MKKQGSGNEDKEDEESNCEPWSKAGKNKIKWVGCVIGGFTSTLLEKKNRKQRERL